MTSATFFIGFAAIGITGLLASLIALGGPKTTGPSGVCGSTSTEA